MTVAVSIPVLLSRWTWAVGVAAIMLEVQTNWRTDRQADGHGSIEPALLSLCMCIKLVYPFLVKEYKKKLLRKLLNSIFYSIEMQSKRRIPKTKNVCRQRWRVRKSASYSHLPLPISLSHSISLLVYALYASQMRIWLAWHDRRPKSS